MKAGGALPFAKAGVRTFACATGMTIAQLQYPPYEIAAWDTPEGRHEIEMWKATGMDLYVHAPFLLNPCDATRRGWYLKQYFDCCKFADALGAKGVVLHPGYKKDLSIDRAQGNLIEFMRRVLVHWQGVTLLETDAGSKNGSKVGSMQVLHTVCGVVNDPRVRICVDTAHLYARGIDVWRGDSRDYVITMLREYIGLVHLNVPDPKVELGSNVDRHNTPFRDCPRPSETMIRDFVGLYPVILERSSLLNQQFDMESIRLATGTGLGISQ